MNIGVIGVGIFGTNYLRTFNELGVNVSWICSKSEETIDKVKNELSLNDTTKSTTNYKDVLEDKDVDTVAIVTPGSTHFSMVKESLLSDKHVIVEKPLAFSYDEAKELIKISEERKKVLMVSYIHLFNPGIQRLKEDIKACLFGNINYIRYEHFGNGPVRKDMNALWDFFPHITSILLYFFDTLPLKVTASGASFLQEGVEDVVSMELKFPDNVFCTAVGSWMYPMKKMQIVVVGDKGYAVFDDYGKDKLKYYNDGKVVIVDIEDKKPLTEQLKHFIECVENNKKPFGMDKALEVVRILESAQKSMDEK
jgi:predicted dehydrogenase